MPCSELKNNLDSSYEVYVEAFHDSIRSRIFDFGVNHSAASTACHHQLSEMRNELPEREFFYLLPRFELD